MSILSRIAALQKQRSEISLEIAIEQARPKPSAAVVEGLTTQIERLDSELDQLRRERARQLAGAPTGMTSAA